MIDNYLNVEGQEKENSKDDGGLSNLKKYEPFHYYLREGIEYRAELGEKDDKFSLVNLDLVSRVIVLFFKDTIDLFSVLSPAGSVYLQKNSGSPFLDS